MEKYQDQVQFVIVYVMEPHPVGSQSPYSYEEWVLPYSYDTEDNPVTQPQTYEERVRLASMCARDAGITALVLVDEMINPVLRIYGPAPNLAYLIGTDGKIAEAQLWYNVDKMESALEQYISSLE